MSRQIDHTVLFFRQFGELLRCGVPVIKSLDVLRRDPDSFDAMLASSLIAQVEGGRPLSVALANAPIPIPEVIVVLTKIGEETGRLAESLAQATEWLKQDRALVQQIWAGLTYPLIVLGVSFLMTLGLFTTVVPKLIAVVTGLGAELPWPTKLVSAVSSILLEPSFWLVCASILCGLAYELTVPEFRQRLQRELCRMVAPLPLLGTTLEAYFCTRMCAGLGSLLESGIEVRKATSLAHQISGHPILKEQDKSFQECLLQGESISEAMSYHPDLYPSLVISFVRLGEESADLPACVMRAGQLLNMILLNRLQAFQNAMEPILTLGVGLVVALVMVATLLPLYSVVSTLG